WSGDLGHGASRLVTGDGTQARGDNAEPLPGGEPPYACASHGSGGVYSANGNHVVRRPTIGIMVLGNPTFDVYRLPDEHQMLREAVRSLAEDKIAPRAAEIDETGEFPYDVRDALVQSGFHAVHIPEEYGGMGADAISACIVVEEVARVCASSSLIPAVNKLGSQPIILSGSEELKKDVLGQVADGAMISYALSERE